VDTTFGVSGIIRESAGPGYRARFDRLFDRGSAAILSGAHFVDVPPVKGGRWGLSCALVPEGRTARRLADVSAELLAVAGEGHWPTGALGAAHFTVRAIEVHREGLSPDDPLVARCAVAIERAAAAPSAPVRIKLEGLTLTPSGVMVCAHPVDDAADVFAARLGAELGDDGWFEATYERDIWYATLLHFAADVRDPAALVDWVSARRRLPLGLAEVDAVELLTFRFNGRQPVRQSLARGVFGGIRGRDALIR
jgi:hypothetical protein